MTAADLTTCQRVRRSARCETLPIRSTRIRLLVEVFRDRDRGPCKAPQLQRPAQPLRGGSWENPVPCIFIPEHEPSKSVGDLSGGPDADAGALDLENLGHPPRALYVEEPLV